MLLRTRTPPPGLQSPRGCEDGCESARPSTGAARAELLRSAAIFVPALDGLPRLIAEAQTAGAAIAAPPGARGSLS